jgi:Ca2+-transporting ATPase
MRQRPRPPASSILGDGLWQHALWVGLVMGALTLAVQGVAFGLGWAWQTMVFTTLALLQLGHALAVRSEIESTFRLGWRTNMPLLATVVITFVVQLCLVYLPPLQPIFETEPLSVAELALVLLVSPAAFVVVEVEKWVLRRRRRTAQADGPVTAADGGSRISPR